MKVKIVKGKIIQEPEAETQETDCSEAVIFSSVIAKKENDAVEHPSHYNHGNIEVIDFIDDQELGFSLGNAVKYICRAGHKGDKVEDLRKAIWYLRHEIDKVQKQNAA